MNIYLQIFIYFIVFYVGFLLGHAVGESKTYKWCVEKVLRIEDKKHKKRRIK